MPKTKEWTVMFYFAADNPLAPGTIAQLKAIKNAGYHPDTNVLALFDSHTVNMPVHVFDVNMVEKLRDTKKDPNIGFSSSDPFVRNLVLDKLWDEEIKIGIQKKTRLPYDPPVPPPEMSKEQNPRDALETFLKFCSDNYPARHYILFIVGHGIVVGNDLFMYDEHGPTGPPSANGNATANPAAAANQDPSKNYGGTGNGNSAKEPDPPQSSLLLTDLGKILGDFKTKIGKGGTPGEFELIGFHSCSMSGVEVALELKGTANYMLASQGPTFVGSWPYRNILIRLFKDVESKKVPATVPAKYLIACGLIDTVKTGEDLVSRYLLDRLNGNVGELSQSCIKRDRDLIKLLIGEFDNPELCGVVEFPKENSSEEVRELARRHRAEPLKEGDLRRLNRFFLEENYEKEMKSVQIRHMLTKIFYYYMYNNFDFQLAGYSCDLTLCDLNKVGYLQTPLDQLAAALINGLDYAEKDSFVRDAILLAHWEAQSFYEESYTDLYDFCFRLTDKVKNVQPDSELGTILKPIKDACDEIMQVLKRGSRGDDYGPIVRSEFCGPLYQYSHGLSVFFPWSEPVDNRMWEQEYGRYKLNQKVNQADNSKTEKKSQEEKEICWKGFLEKYFDATMRATHQDQKDDLETQSRKANLDEDLLKLLQDISTRVYSDGQLGSGGPRDPMGHKGGGLDPTGSDCECGSIKNYPHTTGRHPWQNASRGRQRKPETYAPVASPDMIIGVTTQLIDKEQGDVQG